MRIANVVVTLPIPNGATIEDVVKYVDNAVAEFCGCLSPDNPMRHLDGNRVAVFEQTKEESQCP